MFLLNISNNEIIPDENFPDDGTYESNITIVVNYTLINRKGFVE